MKIYVVTNCAAPSAFSFWSVSPLIVTSFVSFYRKFYLFKRKFDHFYVNFKFFPKVPLLRKCHPGRLAPSVPLGTPLLNWACSRSVETHFKNLGFLGFFKPKKLKLGFLGFRIFKSDFLLFHVKLCKFLRIHWIYNVQHSMSYYSQRLELFS